MTFASDPIIGWLFDADPSIRWQVLRDLTDTPAEIVAAERWRVAREREREARQSFVRRRSSRTQRPQRIQP